MKSKIKRFGVIVFTVFVLNTTVYATEIKTEENKETTAISTEENKGNIEISEEEYNSLINRIEELEQLKTEEINNNLFEFYEKAKETNDTSLGIIFGGLGVATAVIFGAVAIVIGLNYYSGRKTIKEAKETIEKAQDEISNFENKLEKINKIEQQLQINSIYYLCNFVSDEVKKSLYDEIIAYSDVNEIDNPYIYFSKAELFRNYFKLKNFDNIVIEDSITSISIKRAIIAKSKKRIFSPVYLENQNKIFELAISNYDNFIALNPNFIPENLILLAKIRKIECLVYLDNNKNLNNLIQEVNKNGIFNTELAETIVAAIITKKETYSELFNKDILGEELTSVVSKMILESMEEIIYLDIDFISTHSLLKEEAIFKPTDVNYEDVVNYIFENSYFGERSILKKLELTLELLNKIVKYNKNKLGIESTFTLNMREIIKAFDDRKEEVREKEIRRNTMLETNEYTRVLVELEWNGIDYKIYLAIIKKLEEINNVLEEIREYHYSL